MHDEPIVIEGTLSAGDDEVHYAPDYWTPETRLELIGVLFDLAAHNKAGVDGGLLHHLIYANSDFLELNRHNYKEAVAVLERRRETDHE